ncbi:MAG: FAD:protein FMN transferase [Oscillospiraceae bacterium]|nr:FAD:protein FMN transferase [Oscillospiraceae bacterium]
MIRKITISLITTTALFVVLTACDFADQSEQMVQTTESRFMLDTYVILTIHGYAPEGIVEKAFDLIGELESLMSITIENSDIYRINSSGGEPVTVDLRTIEVIQRAVEFGELSGGLFDITTGRLTRLWNFGVSREIPDEYVLFEARQTVDFRQIIISENENAVTLTNPEAWIDLGAIAKGYIADQVAELLLENGVTSALIDMGGDIIALGSRGDGNSWRLAIRNPFDHHSMPFAATIEVSDVAVISSGTYERSFEIDGLRYHHILDPRTGNPAQSDIVSATIIAQNGIIGEGLSTMAILKGSEEITEILTSHYGFIGAVLILQDGEILEIGEVRRN